MPLQSSQSRTAKSKACRDSRDNRLTVETRGFQYPRVNAMYFTSFHHSQKYTHGLYTCVPSYLSSVRIETKSFQFIDKYYICFTSNSVLITIQPFSKKLWSPTLLSSYLLQQKAATSLNKCLFVHLCLHCVNIFYVVSSSFLLNPIQQILSEHIVVWSESDPRVSEASCKDVWSLWI